MGKAELKYDKEQDTVIVPLSYLETLSESVAKKTAKKIYEEIYDMEAQRRNFDKRLYNVRLLLKNYRMLKEHTKLNVSDISNVSDVDISAIAILDAFQNSKGAGKEELKLESVLNSVKRTQILIRYIDDMIGIYKQYCYTRQKHEDLRRADVLDTLFLLPVADNTATNDIVYSLSQKWNVSERQIWRDTSDAIERLTALLFGIDGVSMLESRKHHKSA